MSMKKELKISSLHCERCGKDFFPSLNSKSGEIIEQKKCPICNSRYWKNKVTRKSVSKMMRRS